MSASIDQFIDVTQTSRDVARYFLMRHNTVDAAVSAYFDMGMPQDLTPAQRRELPAEVDENDELDSDSDSDDALHEIVDEMMRMGSGTETSSDSEVDSDPISVDVSVSGYSDDTFSEEESDNTSEEEEEVQNEDVETAEQDEAENNSDGSGFQVTIIPPLVPNTVLAASCREEKSVRIQRRDTIGASLKVTIYRDGVLVADEFHNTGTPRYEQIMAGIYANRLEIAGVTDIQLVDQREVSHHKV